MDRQRIERQLKLAQEKLELCEKNLEGAKDAKSQRKNPKWRSLNADVRALKRRLVALSEVEEREAAAVQRKAEAAAAE